MGGILRMAAAVLAVSWIGMAQPAAAGDVLVEARLALDKGEPAVAARLAMAGGNTDAAYGLLLAAVMHGQVPLAAKGERTFPAYRLKEGDGWQRTTEIAPDGRLLAVVQNLQGSENLEIYDLPSGERLQTFDMEPGEFGDTVYWMSSDLGTLISGFERSLKLTDTRTGKVVRDGILIPEDYYPLEVSDDRRRLGVYGGDSYYDWELDRPWETATKVALVEHDGSYNLRLSPDKRVLTMDDQVSVLRVWDLETNVGRFLIRGPEPADTAFTNDGAYLVTSIAKENSPGATVNVWDLKTWKMVGKTIHMDKVRFAEALPGGHVLALATYDQTVRFFDLRAQVFVGDAMTVADFTTGGWRGADLETMGADHVLHSYAADPRLYLDSEGLKAEACRMWGSNGELRLTPTQAKAFGITRPVDPCGK